MRQALFGEQTADQGEGAVTFVGGRWQVVIVHPPSVSCEWGRRGRSGHSLPAIKEIFKPKLSSRNTIEIPQVPHQETTLLRRLVNHFSASARQRSCKRFWHRGRLGREVQGRSTIILVRRLSTTRLARPHRRARAPVATDIIGPPE